MRFLLFVAFPLSPVPFPVFDLGGTAGNRLNLHFAPRGQARRQVDDWRCDGLGLPPERYSTLFGTCDCGDETPRGTVDLCWGGISARINYEITYLRTYSKKHFGI